MPVLIRVRYLMALALGFGLVVAGGLAAFWVAPAFRAMPHRTLVGVAAAAAVLVGILLIARFFPKAEASSEPSEELHLPGLDLDVKEAKKSLK